MRALVLAGSMVLLLIAVLVCWPRGGDAAPLPVTAPAAVPAAAPAAVPSTANEREAAVAPPTAAPEQAAGEAFDPSPVTVPKWLARFLVVDEDEQPVADAVVTVWAARKIPARPELRDLDPKATHFYSGRTGEPLCGLHSDADGRASATFAIECVMAMAEKRGAGRAGEQSLMHSHAAAVETKFVLEMPSVVHGTVVRADGGPAAGAKVVTTVSGGSILQRGEPPDPGPVEADAEGRFELTLQRHAGYSMHAEAGGERTFTEQFHPHLPQPLAIVLVFPGATTIAGTVVDADGAPVPKADISGWREQRPGGRGQGADDPERPWATADDAGHFAVAVRRTARYQLLAAATGQATSELVWVETTAARPHAEVRLQLQRFAAIRGIVRHGDGSPFAGVTVTASPESGDADGSSNGPTQRDLFPAVTAAKTGEDGAFELTVHPRTTWTVVAYPSAANRQLRVTRKGVAPGCRDLAIAITDDDLAGCVVRGTVATADGKAVTAYTVSLVDYDDSGHAASRSDVKVRIDGGRFELEPLSLGRRVGVQVDAGDGPLHINSEYAPVRQGPFESTKEPIELHFVLQRWGEMPVVVQNADGTPARRVRVWLRRTEPLSSGSAPVPVDGDGRAVARYCVPGAHRLTVWRDTVWRDTDKLLDQSVDVAPGANPEIAVRLPAAGAAPAAQKR